MKWPEIRAGVLAVVIAFGLVEGCPLPAPGDTPEWERGFVEPIRSVQRAVLTPVAWIRTTVRVTQRFALFQGAGPESVRFVIEGQDASHAWHLLYRAGDPEHDAYASLIAYRRVRGVLEPLDGIAPEYQPFCSWLGRMMFADDPALAAVRFRFEKVHLAPGEVEGSGEYEHTVVKVRR